LSGCFTRPAGESGSAYFLMPRGYKLKNHEGCFLLKEILDFNVVIRLPLVFESDTVRFELFFEEHILTPLSPPGLASYCTEGEWKEYMKNNYTKEDTRIFE